MSTKDDVLGILERHGIDVISGQEIARELQISRNSVWKAIKALQQEGYKIRGVTNKGYTLFLEKDVLSPQRIQKYLEHSKQNSNILLYKAIGSTNNEARKFASQESNSSVTILADEQTQGRGHKGRSFFSPPGTGVYMSMLLRPTHAIAHTTLLTTAACVAVCRALESVTGIHAQIKWVNDLFVGGKKIGGILTEAWTDLESGELSDVVLGIGINVSTAQEMFPNELQGIAASLSAESSQAIDRNRLIAEIMNEVRQILDTLEDRTYLEEYKERSCILGKTIEIQYKDKKTIATALSIDQNGGLVVSTDHKTTTTLYAGEVSIRSDTIR